MRGKWRKTEGKMNERWMEIEEKKTKWKIKQKRLMKNKKLMNKK